MEIKDLIGVEVIHKSLGKGIVKDAYDKYLEVQFRQRNSKFSYPAAFKQFLRIEDGNLQSEIEKDLEQWSNENGIQQKEELRKLYEKTQRQIETRRRVSEEKKLRAAQRSAGMRNNNAQNNKNQ